MTSWYDDISNAWKNDVGFLQVISEISGLPVALWLTGEREEPSRWTDKNTEDHPCFSDDTLRSTVERSAKRGPCIFFSTDTEYYGAMAIGPFTLVIGPAAISVPWRTESESSTAKRKDVAEVTRFVKLMHYHFMGAALPSDELPIRSPASDDWFPTGDLEKYQLAQSEMDRSHMMGIDFEKQFLKMIREGDTESLRKLADGPTPAIDDVGEVAENEYKRMEYLVVCGITLMTRAAVEGGLPAETAYEMSDVSLRRLASAVERGEQIMSVSQSAMLGFAEAVRRAREQKREVSYVDACKEYIEKNLRKNLQVSDIAPAIGVSRTYLSRLFHQEEGITVQHYIQREKCRHAARMLQYTDYSIAQIAQYFGFSSQSYFGSCFQTWYGMTPNAYRKANHSDFTNR